MTFSDIINTLTRKPRTLSRIERTIECGAFILLCDGRMGTLTVISERDILLGERTYGWVEGNGFATWITEDDIFIYRNVYA